MVVVAGLACSCVDGSLLLDGDTSDSMASASSSGSPIGDVTGEQTTSDSGVMSSGPDDTTSSASAGTTTLGASSGSESSGSETTGALPDCAPDCPSAALDVLFVVDNTATMGPDQLKLGMAVEALLDQLHQLQQQEDLYLDLNMMVTTTDFGNPLCTPFEPPGYDPARGAPIDTSCTSRLDQFTALGGSPVFTEACTEVCPVAVEPDGPFIHVVGPDDNVPGGTARQALQCLLPQGLTGCGYESTLENMLQALNPAAAWNSGPEPFMRPGADLAIVLLTDESDCSVRDYSVMEDVMYQNVNPNTGAPAASSALCWNAGVTCDPPDGMGIYGDCEPSGNDLLQGVERYTAYLVDELAGNQGKDVMMLALTGIPPVLSHAPDAPFEPTSGGVADLAVRDWNDGLYPAGDIIPEEWGVGVDAADKTFQLGIGPGCTGPDGVGEYSQGQPPVRIQAVCEALDAPGNLRCCMESVCDEQYIDAVQCLRGLVETTL